MAAGSWQLAVGSWQLAVGSWQLAKSKTTATTESRKTIWENRVKININIKNFNHKGHEEKQHLQPQRAQRKLKKFEDQKQKRRKGQEEDTGGHEERWGRARRMERDENLREKTKILTVSNTKEVRVGLVFR